MAFIDPAVRRSSLQGYQMHCTVHFPRFLLVMKCELSVSFAVFWVKSALHYSSVHAWRTLSVILFVRGKAWKDRGVVEIHRRSVEYTAEWKGRAETVSETRQNEKVQLGTRHHCVFLMSNWASIAYLTLSSSHTLLSVVHYDRSITATVALFRREFFDCAWHHLSAGEEINIASVSLRISGNEQKLNSVRMQQVLMRVDCNILHSWDMDIHWRYSHHD